jgi:hypothetical protein
LVSAAAKARQAATTQRERVAKGLATLKELAAQRKSVATTLAETRRSLGSRSSAAKAALKSYETASKGGKQSTTAPALLEKARAEQAAADALFTELTKQTASLRSVEDALARKQEEIRQASAAAQASAAETTALASELQAHAKSNGDAAQQASAAGTAARAALTKAGIAPKGYSAMRSKAEAEDKKLALSVSSAEQGVKAAQAAAKAGPAKPGPTKPAAPKQCDLRKMDWTKLYPPTSETTPDGTNESAVQDVTYPDLDGDGTPEALVVQMHSFLGLTASQVFVWTLVARDRDCNVAELQNWSGPMCASMEARGKLLIFDDLCGEENAIIEYQLAAGKLKETKRRSR